MEFFEKFPKIPRLNRDIVITEKIDGTNAAVVIERAIDATSPHPAETARWITIAGTPYFVWAQSRNRMIWPGKTTDNSGFAAWVHDNAADLIELLGPGRHFGEWWGTGINRNYGLASQRNFSVFRPRPDWEPVRLSPAAGMTEDACLDIVPKLYEGPFDQAAIEGYMYVLKQEGSIAAPGFMNPEGLIVFHTAANQLFKYLAENDELPKGLVQA